MGISVSECREKCERGFTDDYRMRFEGLDNLKNRELYSRGWNRMHGVCDKCLNNNGKSCELGKGEHCER
jgi:hypothetical protein